MSERLSDSEKEGGMEILNMRFQRSYFVTKDLLI